MKIIFIYITIVVSTLIRGCGEKTKIISPSDKIIIIGIDDESIKIIGKWRWPRDIYAKLLKKISLSRPKVIYFDLLFDEIRDVKKDKKFAKEIKKSGNVFLIFFLQKDTNNYNLIKNMKGNLNHLQNISYRGYIKMHYTFNKLILPNELFSLFAESIASAHVIPDYDNKIRKIDLFSRYRKSIFYNIELVLLSKYYGYPLSWVTMINRKELSIYNTIIPVRGEYLTLKFTLPQNSYKKISFIDVIKGNYDKNLFKNKIVLIGVMSDKINDNGRIDKYNTPIGEKYGIELIADGINTLIYYLEKNNN